ncbi:GTP cyclohydrolase [Pricia sp.]|uniref:GTP cyclohydrolase n=1 Tax=Pricia sp. TaxID=2268138 RepID=UPI003592EE12
MKTNVLEVAKKYGKYALLLGGAVLTSCSNDDDAPEEENVLEVFTDVNLVFTNTADGSDVVRARAQDPDGIGVQELTILDEITLTSGATYTLGFEVLNALDPSDPEDIAAEIREEDNEHQFFFSFSADAFTDPAGNGNIDNATDPLNYADMDENGNPVGLSTTWTAGDVLADGSFTARLQHQPDVKTATSDVNDGDTDFDLTFVLNIE